MLASACIDGVHRWDTHEMNWTTTNRTVNRPRQFSYRLGPLAAALAVGFAAHLGPWAYGKAVAGNFIPSCEQAAPGYSIQDPEFNPEELVAAWRINPTLNADSSLRRHGRIIITPIDPLSGNFLEDESYRVPNAQPVANSAVVDATVNGPEWGNSQRGWEIFYSCYSADLQTSRLCRVDQDSSGRWVLNGALPDSKHRTARQPTKYPEDFAPKLYFEHVVGNIEDGLSGVGYGWREDVMQPLDIEMPPKSGFGHWAPEGVSFFHQTRIPGASTTQGRILQLTEYDTWTLENTLLFDDGVFRMGPFPWKAPELGGAVALAALVRVETPDESYQYVEVYRQDPSGNWVVWNTFDHIDPGYPIAVSPEPFVVDGRSYLTVVSYEPGFRTVSPGTPSVVWITSVDPTLTGTDDEVRRVVSAEPWPGLVTIKSDPEALNLGAQGGTRVYYVDHGRGGPGHIPRLVNCDTGL